MAVYERSTTLPASLDEVWPFHSTVDGLVTITPDWMRLAVERVVGPAGEPDPPELLEGSELELSIRPLGLGPRQHWTSRITHRERTETHAVFRDHMVDGPFRRWVHTHRFDAVGDRTRMTDRIEYQLPIGPLAGVSGVAWPGFAAMFAARHRATRRHFS